MIDFDRFAHQTLRLIYRAGRDGYTWLDIEKLLEQNPGLDDLITDLHNEGYITNKDSDGIDITDPLIKTDFSFGHIKTSFCTAKGRAYLQRAALDSLRWFIPILISVLALAVSIVSLVLQFSQNV